MNDDELRRQLERRASRVARGTDRWLNVELPANVTSAAAEPMRARPIGSSPLRPLSALVAVAVVLLFAVAVLPQLLPVPTDQVRDTSGGPGATPTPTSQPSPAALPSPTDAAPSPALQADLVGRFAGSAGLEMGCSWLVDDAGETWEVHWPAGYHVAFEGDAPVLVAADGSVAAHAGDRIWLDGVAGAYAPRELIVRFWLRRLDPVAADRGLEVARFSIVSDWAAQHGLAVRREDMLGTSGSWLMRIVDGTPDADKLDELARLPEVRGVVRNALGSFCMVGAPFTGAAVRHIESIDVPATSAPAVSRLPDSEIRSGRLGVRLTGVRRLVPHAGQERDWLPLGGERLVLSADPFFGRASIWIADLATGSARQIRDGGVLVDVDAERQRLLVRTRSGLVLLDSDGHERAALEVTEFRDAALLADGTVVVVRPAEIMLWDPDAGQPSWSPFANEMDVQGIVAAGTRAVGWDWAYGNAVLDPRTGEQIGEPWPAGSYEVAGSADGRFVAAHVYEPWVGRLELRDAATGAVLAVDPGTAGTTINSITWLSNDAVLVLRSPLHAVAATDPPTTAEIHLVEDFAVRHELEPLVDHQQRAVVRGDGLAVVDRLGGITLMTIEIALSVIVDPDAYERGIRRLVEHVGPGGCFSSVQYDRSLPDSRVYERMADELGAESGFLDDGRAWLGDWLDAARAFGAFEAIDGRPDRSYFLASATGQPWLPDIVPHGMIVLADLYQVSISNGRNVWLPGFGGFDWALPTEEC